MQPLTMETKEFNALNNILPTTEFFAPLNGREIESLVQSIQLCSYKRGEYVFKQGTEGDALYIVYEGTVAVCLKKHFFLPEKVLVTLGTNQIFGEMALLDNHPRSASIRAVTSVKLFVILRSAFDLLFRENAVFKKEIQTIAERRNFHNLHPL